MSFCTECGHPLEAGTAFCTECGTPVEPADASPPPPQAPAQYPPPAAPPSSTTPGRRRRAGVLIASLVGLLTVGAAAGAVAWWLYVDPGTDDVATVGPTPTTDAASGSPTPTPAPTPTSSPTPTPNTLDLAALGDLVQPALLDMHILSCGGPVRASGVITDAGQVVTVAKAVAPAMGVLAFTHDGAVVGLERAVVDPSLHAASLSPTGGNAVGQVAVADEPLERDEDLVAIGYGPDGLVGPTVLSASADGQWQLESDDDVPPGMAVFDGDGVLRGVMVDGQVVDVDDLPGGVDADGQPLPVTECDDPDRPAEPVSVELADDVTDAAAGEAADVMATFFDSINTGDVERAWNQYTPAFQEALPLDRFRTEVATTYDAGAQLVEFDAIDSGRAEARVRFTSLQAPDFAPDDESTCINWDVRYDLERVDGRYRLDGASSGEGDQAYEPC